MPGVVAFALRIGVAIAGHAAEGPLLGVIGLLLSLRAGAVLMVLWRCANSTRWDAQTGAVDTALVHRGVPGRARLMRPAGLLGALG